MELLRRAPVHPVLFAAYAVLFLYATNLDEVLPVDAAAPLGRFVLGAALLTLLWALPFRSLRRGAPRWARAWVGWSSSPSRRSVTWPRRSLRPASTSGSSSSPGACSSQRP